VSRKSVQEHLKRRLLDHLGIAESHTSEEYPLDVRSVAAVLRVSPTTLYKYRLNREIKAAEQRQRRNTSPTAAAIEQDYFRNHIRALTEELDKERERSKNLIGRIAIMEANAARLGIDPEEMHQPILKPVRTTSRAGRGGGTRNSRKPSRTIGT
jgi:DNA anti-recombination protein RmuC